jgi:hypothetical protein
MLFSRHALFDKPGLAPHAPWLSRGRAANGTARPAGGLTSSAKIGCLIEEADRRRVRGGRMNVPPPGWQRRCAILANTPSQDRTPMATNGRSALPPCPPGVWVTTDSCAACRDEVVKKVLEIASFSIATRAGPAQRRALYLWARCAMMPALVSAHSNLSPGRPAVRGFFVCWCPAVV